ncbi:MAG: hypothetical protein FJ267_18310, partial [Planctomycetes bacterium]|nr:hypothetical protein [Planctomycetota bacterium]
MSSATLRENKSPPLPCRRADLTISEQRFQGRTAYFAKDPLTLRYYRFAASEFRLFNLLDGRRNIEQLHAVFCDVPLTEQVSIDDIRQLVERWLVIGLLETVDSRAATRLFLQQRQRKKQSSWMRWLSGILYIKLHAFDPEWILNRIYPAVRWAFHPFGLGLAACLMTGALLLILSRFDQFMGRPEIQSFYAFFNLQN